MNAWDAMGSWGFCDHCHRMVLLNENGFLPDHTRTFTGVCGGSGHPPWPTPETPEHPTRREGFE